MVRSSASRVSTCFSVEPPSIHPAVFAITAKAINANRMIPRIFRSFFVADFCLPITLYLFYSLIKIENRYQADQCNSRAVSLGKQNCIRLVFDCFEPVRNLHLPDSAQSMSKTPLHIAVVQFRKRVLLQSKLFQLTRALSRWMYNRCKPV